MQAPRMLPLLISVLAMPISLPMAILPGPSAMPVIMVEVLAMFSPEHFIIIAEAGVKAKAENIVAVIKIFIGTSLGTKPAECWSTKYALAAAYVSPMTSFFVCCDAARKL